MAKRPPFLKVGNLYSNEEIYNSLGVGNAGGVRVKRNDTGGLQRLALMTSVPTARQMIENPYHDRIEGDILVYTGAGKEGDQALSGPNRRILQQKEECFPIYGFMLIGSRRDKSIGPKRWKFLGLLECLRCYPETQLDSKGAIRKVWIFELRIHTTPAEVPLGNDIALASRLMKEWRSENSIVEDEEVEQVAGETDSCLGAPCLEAIEETRKRLLGYSPVQFEHVISDLLVQTGFEEVVVTKYSQDGGIDVNAFTSRSLWPVVRLMLQVQAKRWLHSVGRKEVAELRGSLRPFARGCIVTTGHFSRAALTEAGEDGKTPIQLVNGFELASIVNERKLSLP